VFSRIRYSGPADGDDDNHLWTVLASGKGERRLTRGPRTTAVTVRTRTGRTLRTFTEASTIVALAVSRRITAALIKNGSRWQIKVYAPHPHTITVPARPSVLSAAGVTLVWNIRRAIYALDVRKEGPHLVTHTAAAPIGLSIISGRIAWADNVGRTARIRTLVLPEG